MMETIQTCNKAQGRLEDLDVEKQDGQNGKHINRHNQCRLGQDGPLGRGNLRILGSQGRIGAIALALLLSTACTPKNESSSSSATPEPATPESTAASDDMTATPSPAVPTIAPVSPTVAPEPLNQGASEPKSTDRLDPLPVVPTSPIAPPRIDTATLPDPKTLALSPPLAKGTFASEVDNTQGTFTILDDEGTAIIQFDQNFQTASRPDLFVVLHVADDLFAITSPPNYSLKEGDYVAIAPLKSSQGTQAYSIPAAIILDNYNSLAIWDRRLNSTLGIASLDAPTSQP